MLAVAVASLLVGCGGDSAGGPSASPTAAPPTVQSHSPDPGLSPEPVPSGTDGVPIVYLLGGSSARECVVGNAAWAEEMKVLGAGKVEAMDLGDTNRTFSQDLAYVRGMDESRPTVVLIGVNLGRFTFAPSPTLADKPLSRDERAGLAGTIDLKHRYSVGRILSDNEKRAMLDKWLTERYTLFRRNHDGNRAMLADLVEACKKRGFHPVILDLPLNLELAGDRLDEPRDTYREDCRRVAEKAGVPVLDFVDDVGLKNGDFYDIAHLVEPGRDKWQTRLSKEVVALLHDDGFASD